MKRRRMLALVATSPLVAGCSELGQSERPETTTTRATDDASTTSARPDSTVATTVSDALLAERNPPSDATLRVESRPAPEPPPDSTEDTVSPLAYPDRPASYTEQAVGSFVAAFERAYRRNALLAENGGDLIAQSLWPAWTNVLATGDSAAVARTQYQYSASVEDGDRVVVSDSASHLVSYYVDASVVVRAAATAQREQENALVPDPWQRGVVLTQAD